MCCTLNLRASEICIVFEIKTEQELTSNNAIWFWSIKEKYEIKYNGGIKERIWKVIREMKEDRFKNDEKVNNPIKDI